MIRDDTRVERRLVVFFIPSLLSVPEMVLFECLVSEGPPLKFSGESCWRCCFRKSLRKCFPGGGGW